MTKVCKSKQSCVLMNGNTEATQKSKEKAIYNLSPNYTPNQSSAGYSAPA